MSIKSTMGQTSNGTGQFGLKNKFTVPLEEKEEILDIEESSNPEIKEITGSNITDEKFSNETPSGIPGVSKEALERGEEVASKMTDEEKDEELKNAQTAEEVLKEDESIKDILEKEVEVTKDFECDVCSKTFGKKIALMGHLRGKCGKNK